MKPRNSFSLSQYYLVHSFFSYTSDIDTNLLDYENMHSKLIEN